MSTYRLRRELQHIRQQYSQPCSTCAEYPMFIVWTEYEEGEQGIPEPDTDPCPECGRVPYTTDLGWGGVLVVVREQGHTRNPSQESHENGF